MRRALPAIVLLAIAAEAAGAQYRAPRSGDYLFNGSVIDARALWVNPAGLAIVPEASVMGEMLVARNTADDFAVAQWTAGFNSRGIAFAFRRDRFDDSTGGNTWRIGAARAFRRVAVGAAFTVYAGDSDQREVDLGARLVVTPGLQLGATVRHIGKPTVRNVRLEPAGVLGLSWTPASFVQLNIEATARDRTTTSGFDTSFRGGVRFEGGRRLPIGLLGAIDVLDDFSVSQIVLGVAVGGAYRGLLVGHAVRRADETIVDGASLTGVASRLLGSGEAW